MNCSGGYEPRRTTACSDRGSLIAADDIIVASCGVTRPRRVRWCICRSPHYQGLFAARTCVTPIIIFGRRGRQVGGRHLPPGIARERERSANSFRSANRRYPRGHNPSSRHQHSQGFYCRGRLAADSWRAQRLPALPPPCRRNTLSKRPICSVTISIACSLVSGSAIGTPALIASSWRTAAARDRRASATKSIVSTRFLPCFAQA